MIWPELEYELNDHTSIGLAYYSQNLVKEDLLGWDIHSGLESGVAQLIFGVSL